MSTGLRGLLVVVLSALAVAPAARGQQAVAEFVGMGQPLFVEDDLRELARIYGLSSEQKTAAEILLRSGTERAQKAYMKLLSRSPWVRHAEEPIPEEAEEQTAYYTKQTEEWQRQSIVSGREVAAVEREVLRDVEVLLDKEQAGKGWSEFDRYRRRVLVQGQGWYWYGCDPASLLKAAKVSETDSHAAAPLLSKYEEGVDQLLIQSMNALRRINDEFLSSGKMDPQTWMRPELKHMEIRRLNVRTIREIEGVISEDGAAAVRRQRVGTEMSMYFQPPQRDQAVASVLAIPTLTQEQKDRMQHRVDQAEDDLMRLATDALKVQDDLVLGGEDMTAVGERMKEPQKRATQKLVALAKELKGELTEEQRAGVELGGMTEESVDQLFKQKRSALPDSGWRAKGSGTRKPGASEP